MSIIENDAIAPLDTLNMVNNTITNHYMVTVNVSPKKYISNKSWQMYSNIQQEQLLLKTLQQCIEQHCILELVYRFENTQAGMRHLHFTCFTTRKDIDEVQMLFHKKFGMPKLDPCICCHVTETIVDIKHGIKYVCKEDKDKQEVPDECLFKRKH